MKFTLYTLIVAASFLLTTTTQAQTISTYAGTGTIGNTGDDGPATAALLSSPGSSVMDAAGNLYITDKQNNRIRKVSALGIISNFAGTGTAGLSGDGGAATAAQFNLPVGITADPSGNIYVADYGNSRIRKIATSGIITTVAGSASGFAGDGGAATAASLNNATDMAVDAAGNIYIADYGNHCIRKVNVSGTISTIAGNSLAGYSGDGGASTAAQLNGPNGVAVDGSGNIYIADLGNARIRKITAAGNISTIAGSAPGYSGDNGPATAATLSGPAFLTVDMAGNIFISDMGNSVVRRIGISGNIVTVAGSNTAGYAGDGGPATAARMLYPTGLSFDANGSLYVTEQLNNIVRKVAVATVILSGANTVCIGETTPLSTAAMEGIWLSSNTSVATVNTATGVVTGVSTGTATISFSTGLAKGIANITVNDCTTGIEQATANNIISVFPNPVASGTVSITLPSNITLPAHLILTNSIGQTVTDMQVTSSTVTMDVHVPTGVYILSIISGADYYRTKIAID